jgi:hypothetical protein
MHIVFVALALGIYCICRAAVEKYRTRYVSRARPVLDGGLIHDPRPTPRDMAH